MTLTEVCIELGISRNTAYTRIKEGILRPLPDSSGAARKIPRYRFDRSEVQSVREKQRPSPAPPAPGQGTGLPGSGVKREE